VNGFGPTPPLLTAARWLPTSAMENADLEYDLAMNAKFRFRGALSFTVETKFWINWPRERYASIPLQVRENKNKKRERERHIIIIIIIIIIIVIIIIVIVIIIIIIIIILFYFS
jgi:hypothetical protein